MEEDKRVLLEVADLGEETSVRFNTESERDLASVALAIDQIMRDTPSLRKMLLTVSIHKMLNPEFEKEYEKNSVKVPDFDKILKDLK